MKPHQPFEKDSTQERERKRNKGQGPKFRQANSPKEAGHKEEREPLIIKTSTKSHDAYQLKKEEVNMIKLQA